MMVTTEPSSVRSAIPITRSITSAGSATVRLASRMDPAAKRSAWLALMASEQHRTHS